MDLVITIIVSLSIFLGLRYYLHRTGYYYHSKYDRRKQRKNKNPHTGGNR